jgi:MinD-like ATPase involved in chromosome partitioning or flagellar assembly
VIIAVGSVRGAPGVTSWALLLAAAWPAELAVERAALETDVSGGVCGARYGLGVDPGAVSLTAALRRTEDTVPVEAHGRWLAGGVWVVPGPESAEQAARLWENSAEAVAERLVADPRVWFADLGRLVPRAPELTFAARAMFTVLVTGPDTEQLVGVPTRVAALQRTCGGRIGVLVVGNAAHPSDELRSFFGVEEVWTAAASGDLRAEVGAVLDGRPRARRSMVWRDALDCASRIAALTTAGRSLAGGVR